MKNISARIFLFVFFASFLLLPAAARAAGALTITEIMYDLPGTDTGHEWAELYNPGASSVTIVGGSAKGGWRFSDGSNHTIAVAAAQGSLTVPAGGFLVLADDASTFLSDYPGFTGSVADTTVSLPNSGGTVKIIDGDGNIVDSVTYASSQGASADGNTLQKIADGSWVTALPTPGAANATVAQPPASQTTTDTTTDTETGTTHGSGADTSTTTTAPVSGSIASLQNSNSSSAPVLPTMQATLTSPIQATVGLPVSISSTVYDSEGSYRLGGDFEYALGDGTDYQSAQPESFKHTYAYPGTYLISFEYRSYADMPDPEISVTRQIDVVASPIVISSVQPDGAVELSNPSDDQADISGWQLLSLQNPSKFFIIPKGTIVLSGKNITLPSAVTGFTETDSASLGLMMPSGKVSAVYGGQSPLPILSEPPQAAPVPVVQASSEEFSKPASSVQNPATVSAAPISEPAPEIETPASADLPANAISSITATPSKNSPAPSSASSLWPFIVGFLGIVGIGAYLLVQFRSPNPLAEKDPAVPGDTETVASSVRIIEDEEDNKSVHTCGRAPSRYTFTMSLKDDELKLLHEKWAKENSCDLKKVATQPVFGDGPATADIVFIGEAPGKSEDEQGKPFVGAAGKFLAEMLAEIKLRREDVYITNIVKYRPPNNRDPEPQEKVACEPWLYDELNLIHPKLIVFLGRHSMNDFFPNEKISVIHGKLMHKKFKKIKTEYFLPLYHPASALYNGGMRDTLMQDFRLIPKILEKFDSAHK